MARRGQVRRRKIEKDPVYGSIRVSRLINRSMKDGKKSVIRHQVYTALETIRRDSKKDPVEVLDLALDNISPSMEVRSRRVGGAAYQVPSPVRGERRETLAIRWLVNAARARSNSENHTFADKLAVEIQAAANKEGVAIAKKAEVEKIAEANRAFAHFRW